MNFKILQGALGVVFLSSITGCGLLGGGGITAGISGGIGGTSYGPYKIRAKQLVGLPTRELATQTSVTVPPDRGTVAVDVDAYGEDYASTAAQVRKAIEDLKKIGGTAGCGFEILDYDPPTGKEKKWSASLHTEITATVTGAKADEVLDKADACFKPLRDYLNVPKQPKTPVGFDVAASNHPTWSVDVLDKHRDELLTQANERFKAVQKTDAKMWDHGDMQCTSAGVVTVADATSHGVILQLEMYCPVAHPETGSGPGAARQNPK